jgi:hypothetical protein
MQCSSKGQGREQDESQGCPQRKEKEEPDEQTCGQESQTFQTIDHLAFYFHFILLFFSPSQTFVI